MASPTLNRGMTYPVHGGAVGAWDTPLNADFENMDLAFGTYPITITATAAGATYNTSGAVISSTVATVTLPTSLALNFHYPVSGTITRNITVVWSSVGGYYDVFNNSSGAFSITATVSGSTGSGVVTPQGGHVSILSDGFYGSNVMYPASDAFTNIVATSLTAASTVTALDFVATGTGANTQPIGTTAQRPTAAAGLVRYNSDLADFEVSDPNNWRPVAVAQPIASGVRNLAIGNSSLGGTNALTQVGVAADAITVETTGGVAYRSSALSLTIKSSVVGANGIDVGGLGNTTSYGIWTIYSSTGNAYAGLLSASFSAPTMPAGYNAKARIGSIPTNGSAHFQNIIQQGRSGQYVVVAGSTTAHLPILASGAAGNLVGPVWAAISLTNLVPPTASRVMGSVGATNSDSVAAMAAPNNSYGIITGSSNPPPTGINTSGANFWTPFNFMLESANIYWISNSANGVITLLGWEDNLC